MQEVLEKLEAKGRAWDEHKKAVDEMIKTKADGKSVADLEAKLEKTGGAMDAIDERVTALLNEIKAMKRPGGAGSGNDDTLQTELKAFNLHLQAHFQAKGRPFMGDVSAESYAQYKSGFFALARHGNHELLTADERKAMLVGSDPDGGFLVPPATVGRIVKKVYEKSSLRQLANVVTISTNDIEGLIDNDEADAGWVGETQARAETGTPQVGKWRIEAHEMYAKPRVTQKLLDDAAIDIEAWLADKVADRMARLESTAFMTGDGVGKPRGLFSYPTAATADSTRAWGTFEHVKSGASGDFHTTKADPLLDLLGAFKNEYLAGATWLMPRAVRTKLRKMKIGTSDDRYLWEPSLEAGAPDRLLGYPVRVDQYVPGLGSGSLSVAFGDFREAFMIVDRIGLRTLRDPYTAKPYVVFYSTRRVGSGAVNFEAVKFIKFDS